MKREKDKATTYIYVKKNTNVYMYVRSTQISFSSHNLILLKKFRDFIIFAYKILLTKYSFMNFLPSDTMGTVINIMDSSEDKIKDKRDE